MLSVFLHLGGDFITTKYKCIVATELFTSFATLESDAAVFPSLFMDFAKKYGLRSYLFEDGHLVADYDSTQDYMKSKIKENINVQEREE